MRRGVEARIPGVVLCTVGLAFVVGGSGYGIVQTGRMGPGLMPVVAGLSLAVLGLVLAVLGARTDDDAPDSRQTSTSRAAGSPEGVGSTEGTAAEARRVAQALGQPEVEHPRRPWIIFGTVVLAMVVTPILGLILSLAAMTFVLLLAVERESWRLAVAVTVMSAAVSWLIFVYLLNVPLPEGLFAA